MRKKKTCRYKLCQNYQRGTPGYCSEACEVDHQTYKLLLRRAKGKVKPPKKIRVLCCGARDWKLKSVIRRELTALKDKIELVIEGGANGADVMCRAEAWRLKLPVVTFYPNWVHLGHKAGPIRNDLMRKFGKPDLVLAFHQDIASSKGTKSMIKIAKRYHIKVKLFDGFDT